MDWHSKLISKNLIKSHTPDVYRLFIAWKKHTIIFAQLIINLQSVISWIIIYVLVDKLMDSHMKSEEDQW